MASFNSLKFDSETAEKLKGITHYDKQVGENWPVVYILSNNKGVCRRDSSCIYKNEPALAESTEAES